ncbi:probable tyrosyl-DNA phosphodiesterase [Schistocerca gregaria]|uniref:probable tyrosyl-DNA phosphodiesterase n=1 Tax=Schistocerca gregaria TaxID=7010 RepID=UPI00211E1303|nr:probable tyrosyl-DNA phosphodiesterase [Schistocerca gregaria]
MSSSSPALKRPYDSGSASSSPAPQKKSRTCTFGESCYRRNPNHFSEYEHPHLDKLLEQQEDAEPKLPPDYKPKTTPSIVLAQLMILQDLNAKNGIKGKGNEPKNKPAVQEAASSSTFMRDVYKQSQAPKKQPHTTVNSPSTSVGSRSSSSDSRESKRNVQQKTSTEKLKERVSEASSSSNYSNNQATHDKGAERLSKESRLEMKRKIREQWNNISSVVPVSDNVLEKLAAGAPYNFFLTTVLDSRPTHSEMTSITFADLLHPSLGELKASLQVNFMVELEWLLEQYDSHGYKKKPLLILYEDDGDDFKKCKNIPDNVKGYRVKPGHAFGHHHTKMSIFCYDDDSVRVVISTANLIASDFENRTQGLWVSPRCPRIPLNADTKAGDSITEFRADLMRYLSAYQMPVLQEWITRIRCADFSKVRVCLVGSVPGTHRGADVDRWGHRRMAAHLKRFAEVPNTSWPLFFQCSSIGSLGATPDSWMCGEFRASLAQSVNKQPLSQQPPVKVIYPCFRNVAQSIHGLLGGDCLPYSIRTHGKQAWFTGYLHEWKSDSRYRSEAMPHIKTYGRASPDWTSLAWFHLSSANLSKAAWGMASKGKTSGSGHYIMSYELGVLFLPQLLIGKSEFRVGNTLGNSSAPSFPLPFDVPPTPYGERDKPWVTEYMTVKF